MAVSYTNKQIVTDGLVLALDAGNHRSYPGSGTTWTDLSGEGNNGTLTNGPTFDSGNGGSIVFDGVNDYINCGTQSNLTNILDISVCVWVYPISKQASNVNTIVNRYFNTTSSNGWAISFRQSDTTNDIQFGFAGREDSNLYIEIASDYSYSYNNWYFICGVKQGNSWKIYVNDTFQNSNTFGNGSTVFGNNVLYLGAFPQFNYYSDTQIALTQIYNRALSSTEVLQNYNVLKSRFGL